jgi:2-polyprenyl-3-methyl-5-hydroxy-6-metoxy-1,4-benzoquinol methylase
MLDFWNERYGEEDFAYGTEPNRFLSTCTDYLKPGMKALAVADGEGRNGVWLAEHGLEVTTVDYSESGVEKSNKLAAERGVTINALCADLNEWQFPENEYDLIVSIFAHFPPELRKKVHNGILTALKPGGHLILESYHPRQLEFKTGGPPVAEMMYSIDTLEEDFPGAEIVKLEDLDVEVVEGKYHFGMGAVTRLILRKP